MNLHYKADMKKLTNKEREIMELFWQHGPMFVRELLDFYDEPRPHINTLSTMVRILEKNGFLGHKQFGTSFQYFPIVEEQEFGKSSIADMVKSYFDDSYLNVVSSFVNDKKISVEELQLLIDRINDSK